MKHIEDVNGFDRSTLNPFHNLSLLLCNNIREKMLSSRIPELVTLGYFFRPSRLVDIIETHKQQRNALGTVVHYAPSNVGTTFAYFWMLSMLCGNSNIVRLSDNSDPLQQKALDIIESCLDGKFLYDNNLFLHTTHDKQENDVLSSKADLRVIWGSDKTVDTIRQSSLNSTARDLIFSHKYSIAVSDTKTFLDSDLDVNNIVTDITLFDQRACTSPRALFLLNDGHCDNHVYYMNKLQESAMIKNVQLPKGSAHLRIQWVQKVISKHAVRISTNDYDSRVFVAFIHDDSSLDRESVVKALLNDHPSHNSIVMMPVSDKNINDFLLDKNLQTIVNGSWMSSSKLSDVISPKHSFNRIVRPGQSSSFDVVWDGRDLIDEFTNKVQIS